MRMRFVSMLLSILLLNNFLFAGFAADILIKTPTSYVAIKDIKVGDLVMGFNHNNVATPKRVINTCAYYFEHAMSITIDDQIFITSYGQRFYLPLERKWKRARDLSMGDRVLKNSLEHAVVNQIELSGQQVLLYDIGVEGRHNFFISEHEIIAHNFVPIVIGLAWVFGGGTIEFAGATLGLTALGAFFGIKLYKNKDSVDRQSSGGLRIGFHGSPSPEDPEEFAKKHPNGRYHHTEKHNINSKGRTSPAPKDGQAALDISIPVKDTSTQRVGVSAREIVILKRTGEGLYHGYVVDWSEIIKTPSMIMVKNALLRSGLVDKFGNIL